MAKHRTKLINPATVRRILAEGSKVVVPPDEAALRAAIPHVVTGLAEFEDACWISCISGEVYSYRRGLPGEPGHLRLET